MGHKYAYFWTCSDCDEPTHDFDFVEYLGYNCGVDGHMFESREKAENAWQSFEEEFLKTGPKKATWLDGSPFKMFQEELDWLKKNVNLYELLIERV